MMACDGIWDCLSNQECVDKVKEIVDEEGMQEATDGLNKITE
jgi:serine/threonine protein phosphatase PrpC